MPFDSNGVATVTRTIAVTGQIIQAAQVNVPFADIQAMLSSTMLRTGVGQATGDLNFGGFKAVNLAPGTNPQDAINKDQLDTRVGNVTAGYLFGLTMSNNLADLTNDIDIAPGSATDGVNPIYVITLGLAITKRLDAAWFVGTNQGGLDTGSIANTTYHVFLIQRSDTGVVDVLFSTSATNPTMPASYDRRRRIGTILREGGSIVTFRQYGDVFKRNSPFTAISGVTPYAALLTAMGVPLGIVVQPLFDTRYQVSANSTGGVLVGDAGLGGIDTGVAGASASAGGISRADSFTNGGIFTNTAGQIYTSMAVSGTCTFFDIRTTGWIDSRGRIA